LIALFFKNHKLSQLKLFIKILVGLYIIICVGLYITQEKFIFYPHPLNDKYTNTDEIRIEVDSEIELHCLWQKRKNSKGVLLYFHGNKGNVSRGAYQTSRFNPKAYDVFIPDYRGYGKSDGHISSDIQLLTDANKVYSFLKEHYPENKIVIVGYSLGSGMASYVASKNNPHRLFLVAPFTSLMDIKNQYLWMIPNFVLKYKLSNKKYLKEVTAPVTIIHGTNDTVVDYVYSEELKNLYPDLELITLNGVGHRDVIFKLSDIMDKRLD